VTCELQLQILILVVSGKEISQRLARIAALLSSSQYSLLQVIHAAFKDEMVFYADSQAE